MKNMVRHRKLLLKMKEQKNWWPPFQLIKKVMAPLSAHQKSHDPPPYSTGPPSGRNNERSLSITQSIMLLNSPCLSQTTIFMLALKPGLSTLPHWEGVSRLDTVSPSLPPSLYNLLHHKHISVKSCEKHIKSCMGLYESKSKKCEHSFFFFFFFCKSNSTNLTVAK